METTSAISIFGVSILACLVVCDGQVPAQYQYQYNAGFKYGKIVGEDFAKGNFPKAIFDGLTIGLGAIVGFFVGGINGLLGYSCNPNCGNSITIGTGVGYFDPVYNIAYPQGCYQGQLIREGNVTQGVLNGTLLSFFAILGFVQGFEATALPGNSGNTPLLPSLTNLLTG